MEIPNNILALLVLVSVGLSITALILRGPKGIPGEPGKSIQGGQGVTGPPGPAGPQGPAGTMIVQCSPTSSGTNNCKGVIPGSLDVNGQLTSDTITTSGQITADTITTSGQITSNGGIKTNTLTATDRATFDDQVEITGLDGLKLTQGSIAVQAPTAYITVGYVDRSSSDMKGIYTSGDISAAGNIYAVNTPTVPCTPSSPTYNSDKKIQGCRPLKGYFIGAPTHQPPTGTKGLFWNADPSSPNNLTTVTQYANVGWLNLDGGGGTMEDLTVKNNFNALSTAKFHENVIFARDSHGNYTADSTLQCACGDVASNPGYCRGGPDAAMPTGCVAVKDYW